MRRRRAGDGVLVDKRNLISTGAVSVVSERFTDTRFLKWMGKTVSLYAANRF